MLIVKLGALGDIMIATPAIRAIQKAEHDPQARNLFDVIAVLQKREGVHVQVRLSR